MMSLARAAGQTSSLGRTFRLILLLGVLETVWGPQSAFSGKAPDWVQTSIEEGLAAFPDAPTLILQDRCVLEVDDSGRQTTTVQITYHVRDGDVSEASSMGMPETHFIKVERMKAWHFDADGNVHDDFEKVESGYDQTIYSDSKAFSIHVPGVGPGSVVAYEMKYRDEFEKHREFRFYLDGSLPSLRSEVTARIPNDWTIEGFRTNLANRTREEWAPNENSPTQYQWSWGPQDKANELEGYSPSNESLASSLQIRFRSPGDAPSAWSSVARWYLPYSESALEGAGQLGASHPELLAQSVQAIAEYVRNKVTYEQVYLGDGGWRPHSALAVEEKLFGDCKDMAHLVIGLLRAKGVRSYPVLIHTDPDLLWSGALPSRRFNHCIVAIENEPSEPSDLLSSNESLTFYDPTAKSIPFGRLPASLEGSWGLVVGLGADTVDAPAFQQLPGAHPADNTTRVECQITLLPDLSATAVISEVFAGQRAFQTRAAYRDVSSEDIETSWSDRLSENIDQSILSDFEIDGLEREDSVTVRYEVSIPKLGKRIRQRVLIQPNFLSRVSTRIFDEPVRQSKVRFPYVYTSKTNIEVVLPPSWSIESLPELSEISNDFGTATREVVASENGLSWMKQETVKTTELPLSEFSLAEEWGRVRYEADQERVVLRVP